MSMIAPFIPIFVFCIQGLFWGVVTQIIIDNKGYQEKWFWWGFFFGLIAVIVALLKPSVQTYDTFTTGFLNNERDRAYVSNVLEEGGWKCHFCNRANPSYTGTCACGRTKADTLNFEKMNKEQMDSLDKIKRLKELLDIGALTQEEFEAKKKELLKEVV